MNRELLALVALLAFLGTVGCTSESKSLQVTAVSHQTAVALGEANKASTNNNDIINNSDQGLLVQNGQFDSVPNEEGIVYFPIPYEVSPNVEFTGSYSDSAVVKEVTPSSFKWKAVHKANYSYEVKWRSRGIQAHKR